MSRRDRHDEQGRSRSHSSRFDRSPSPKRSRRDGKPATERTIDKNDVEGSGSAQLEQNQGKGLKDLLPLEDSLATERESQPERKDEPNRKNLGPRGGNKRSSDPTEAPRSRYYFQHDDRRGAGHGSQSFGGRDTRRWSEAKEKHSSRDSDKLERPRTHTDEKETWKHDRFHELESEVPPPRKRPAFREKKEPTEATEAADAIRSEALREETRARHTRTPEKSERPSFREDQRYRGDIPGRSYQSRDRYGRWGMRGRERFNSRYGERNMRREGGPVQKWSHDLFEEANKTPPPKNDEEQIAKIEALLAT